MTHKGATAVIRPRAGPARVTAMRPFGLVVASLGIVFGVAVEWAFYDETLGLALTAVDFLVGSVLILSGAIASDRRDESRVGAQMTLTGFAWFLGNLGGAAVYFHRGPLVQLVLSYPSGRLSGRIARVVVLCAYADALVLPLAQSDVLTLLLAGAVAFSASWTFLLSSGPARRAGAPALLAGLVLAAALALTAAGRLAGLDHRDGFLLAYDLAVVFVTIVLLVDLLRGRWAERAVKGLVIDLGASFERAGLQARLARALGDPSLVLGYRLAGGEGFVDEAGRVVGLPAPGSGKTATMLEERGEQIGVLVHDDALLADPVLIRSVAAAAQLALANARLQAEARAQTAELERSRRRIVEATDRERLRLENELREGPEHLLERTAARLVDAAAVTSGTDVDAISALEQGLDEARQELREFGQGIRPAALSEGGLMAALASLAQHSPLQVEVRGQVTRLPEPIEATLYFVCSEGLANAVKHALASRVVIDVREARSAAVVAVSDDGVGRASVEAGSGLRGLADRVESLGGRFEIESPPGGGTSLRAEVPLPA